MKNGECRLLLLHFSIQHSTFSIPLSSSVLIWGFLAVAVPLILTPGVSTAVVLRNSLRGGVRAGLATTLGVNASSVCFGLLSAFGFAVALQRWPSLWLILRSAGIAYLAWLGIQSLRHAFAAADSKRQGVRPGSDWGQTGVRLGSDQGQTGVRPGSDPLGSGFGAPAAVGWVREGFLTNMMNPALATFYFVILPQFIPAGASIARTALLLTAVHVTLAASWHTVWAIAGGTLAAVLTSGRPRQALDLFSGVAMILLAVRLAFR
jgi:threonine/homoserine/homoserine lactone efflux protein